MQGLTRHAWHSGSTQPTPDVVEGQHGVRDVLEESRRSWAPLLQRAHLLPQLRVAVVALLPLLQHEAAVMKLRNAWLQSFNGYS